MPIDDYLVRSGAKELLSHAVAEILALRPRVPVHALANHFHAIALGPSIATAAKALRASHPSKRAFPDVSLRVFSELVDGQSQLSSAAATSTAKAKTSTKTPATTMPGNSSAVARSMSSAMLKELLVYLTAEFPKRIQAQVLQRLLRPTEPALAASNDARESVGFDAFVRAVDACLLLEELLDAANELFRLLQTQQQESDMSAEAPTRPLTGELERALQSAALQLPEHQELLRALLLPSTDDSDASPSLFSTVTTASDVQDTLARLALGEEGQV